MKLRALVGIVITAIVVLIGAVWYREATLPVAPGSEQIETFVVDKGEGVRRIAQRLSDRKLIRSPLAFFLVIRRKDLAKKIQAGEFELSPAMSVNEIAEELTHGTFDTEVTIPEGWRNGQIAMKLSRTLEVTAADILEHAEEGYMFPDTYFFPKQSTAQEVVEMFRDNFDRKVRRGLEQEIMTASLDLNEIVILASIVEREAKFEQDRPLVAGVLLNRLDNDIPLQADATLQYIKGYDESTGTWWSIVTPQDKKLDSAYNTYKFPGLPPGPICNPGLASVKAVTSPAETDYLYYISEEDGTMHYAETLDGHNENIRKYLQ